MSSFSGNFVNHLYIHKNKHLFTTIKKKKIVPLTFRQTCVDNVCYNTNICILLNLFKIHVFKETVAKLIFNFTCFTFFIIMSEFTLNSMNSFRKIIDKI